MTWHHVEQMRLVAIGHPGVRVRKPKNNALSHLTALGECQIDEKTCHLDRFGMIRDYHFIRDMKNQIWTGKSHGCFNPWPWQTRESMAGKILVRSKEIAALLPLRRAEAHAGDGTIVEWLIRIIKDGRMNSWTKLYRSLNHLEEKRMDEWCKIFLKLLREFLRAMAEGSVVYLLVKSKEGKSFEDSWKVGRVQRFFCSGCSESKGRG